MNKFKKITEWFDNLAPEVFVLIVNLVFYFGLLFINPSNKFIAFTFVILFLIYNYKFRNIKQSLIYCYLTGLIIISGKTYEIELIPKKVFTDPMNKDGYKVVFTISPGLIVGILMIIIMFRDAILGVKKMNTKFYFKDLFLILYYIGILFTDTFFSKMPDVSVLVSLSGLVVLFAFFFIRFYKPSLKLFLPLVISIIASQIFFESFVALQQFVTSSPLGKSIESPIIYQSMSNAPDELSQRFRPMGTMVHANNFAAWLVFYLLILFAYNYKKANIYYFLINLFGGVVLALTLSRGAWITYFMGTLFCLYYFEKVKKIGNPYFLKNFGIGFLIIGAALILFFIFPRAEKSLNSGRGGVEFRANQLSASSDILKNNIVFGVGTSMSLPEIVYKSPNKYFRKIPMPVHNWYVLSLIEHGFFPLLSILLFIVLTVRTEIKDLFTKGLLNEIDTFKLGFIASIFVLIIIAFLQPFLLENVIILTSAIIFESSRKSHI
jgi:hypothetical protein